MRALEYKLRLWVGVLCVFVSALAAADGVRVLPPTRFRAQPAAGTPPTAQSPAPSTYPGPVQLEFSSDIPISELGSTLQRAGPALPEAAPRVVPFYFTRGTSREEQMVTIHDTLEQIRKVWPGANPRVLIRFREAPNAESLRNLRSAVDAAAAAAPGDAGVQSAAATYRAAIDRTLQALASAERRRAEQREAIGQRAHELAQSGFRIPRESLVDRFLMSPTAMAIAKPLYAAGRVLFLTEERVRQAARTGNLSSPVALGAAVGVTALDGVSAYVLNRFPYEIARAEREHGIPFRSRSRFLQRLNTYFTSERAKTIKGFVYNLLTGVGTTMAEQEIQSQYLPGVSHPTVGSFLNSTGNNVLGAFIGGWGANGMENLRQKRLWSQNALNWWIRIVGVFDPFVQIFESFGDPHSFFIARLLRLPGQLFYSGAALLDYGVSARNDRLPVLAPELDFSLPDFPAFRKGTQPEAYRDAAAAVRRARAAVGQPRTSIDESEGTDAGHGAGIRRLSTAPGAIESGVAGLQGNARIQPTRMERLARRVRDAICPFGALAGSP